jgi:hypothetical protein
MQCRFYEATPTLAPNSVKLALKKSGVPGGPPAFPGLPAWLAGSAAGALGSYNTVFADLVGDETFFQDMVRGIIVAGLAAGALGSYSTVFAGLVR